MPSVESAKRKLHFDDPRINRMETERTRAPVWKIGRRLDFGETDPSVLLYCADFLSNQTDPDLLTRSSSRDDRIIFTTDQKCALEAMFRKIKYPVRKERAALAAKLDVPLNKVTTWFSNRRQRWRKEQKRRLVGTSGSRPVLHGSSLIQTSHQRSFQSAVGFTHSVEFPARLEEPSQRFPPIPYQVNGPVPSASNLINRPIPVTVAPPAPLPCQQVYPPFPAPVRHNPQQYSDTYYQHTAASWFPNHHSMPAGHPVPKPCEFNPDPGADLANDFPYSYFIAKELPHIFGNVYEDEVLERALTPSFELPVEFESICDSLSESDQSVETSSHSSGNSEDFIDDVQPSVYDSCCFGSNRDFSYGFLSKGINFELFRQE